MARLATSGFETLTVTANQQNHPDGAMDLAFGLAEIDQTVKRTGLASLKFVEPSPGGAPSFCNWQIPSTLVAYGRAYLLLDSYPAATMPVIRFGISTVVSVRLTSSGQIQLWKDPATAAQLGSNGPDTFPLNEWVMLELGVSVVAGASVDSAEIRMNGVSQVAVAGQTIADVAFTNFIVGLMTAESGKYMWCDDVAVNNNTGTTQNSWPGQGSVIYLRPKAVGNVAAWTDCAGTTTNIIDCLDPPPIGIADHTTAGHAGATAHQIRNQSGTLPQTLEVYCESYGGAGLQGNVMQTDTAGTALALGDASARTQIAQVFRMTGHLDYCELHLAKVGSPTDDLTLELRTCSGGLPTATVMATSSVVAASSLSTTAGWIRFDMPEGDLVPRTDYALVLKRSGAVNGSNYVKWSQRAAGASNYQGGTDAVYNGSTWAASTGDYAFRCFNSEGFAQLTGLYPYVCHAEAVSTGTKTGSLELDQNPVSAAVTFDYGNNIGAAGTLSSTDTTWPWKLGTMVDRPTFTNMGVSPRVLLKKTDSGTRAALACSLGVVVEYNPPESGWVEYVKTSDSTHWWAKRANVTTEFYQVDDTSLVVQSGDYALTPNPIDAANMMSSIDDATLQANYTRA